MFSSCKEVKIFSVLIFLVEYIIVIRISRKTPMIAIKIDPHGISNPPNWKEYPILLEIKKIKIKDTGNA